MAAEANGRAMTRVLIAVFEGEEVFGVAHLARLIGLARVQGAVVRVAYFHRLPRERVDRHDRVVADRYREMLRIEETMREAVASALRVAGRAPVECVVRFGVPLVEVRREVEAFEADVVAFAPGADLRARWHAWRVRRCVASLTEVRLLVIEGGAEVWLPARVADRVAMLSRAM